MIFGGFDEGYLRAVIAILRAQVVVDDAPSSAEALADKAAGFHPMAKPVKQSVQEHPGPQKHGADAVPLKALRLGWSRE